MNVGFIGLGRMGKPMALNLVAAGFEVMVKSRSQGPIDELIEAGACEVDSVSEIARYAEVVCTCLPEVEISRQIYLNPDGLVSSGHKGLILIEHSTINPALAKEIYLSAMDQGIEYLDAPVSGGVNGASEGTLTVMAGGNENAFRRALPILESVGERVHLVGRAGQGSVFKLINQLLTCIHTLAACEAMLLGKMAGADLSQLVEVLKTSWGSSTLLLRHAPLIISETYGSQAPTRLLVKDMTIIEEFANEIGVPITLGERTRELLSRAIDQGLGEIDVSSLITVLQSET